jgi:AraC-like DNA-binding protein
MDYQVIDPSAELQPFVKCFWTLEDDASENPVKQRVVPDGCMEMIFHYGDLYRQYFEDGSSIIQPRCFVFGQITRFLEIEPTGVTGIVSARFHPDGLLPFINVPVKDLENKAVGLHELFSNNGKILEEEVIFKKTNADRIEIIEKFLLSFLELPQTIDKITKSCVDVILHSSGQLNLDELAGKLKINRRSIERKMSSAVGISPKQLAKIIRLQASMKMLEKKQFTSLTSLAYENGYYDQAHFIKDFKEFTGLSPKSFYADSLKLSTLFTSAE